MTMQSTGQGARQSSHPVHSEGSTVTLAPEDTLLVARKVFGDGRTRAYAWGRAAAREDVAATVERVLAMSGQFEQRRLARPAYQLEVPTGHLSLHRTLHLIYQNHLGSERHHHAHALP